MQNFWLRTYPFKSYIKIKTKIKAHIAHFTLKVFLQVEFKGQKTCVGVMNGTFS